jgi:hypothetical protein
MLKVAFAGIWPIIGYFSIGGIIIAICIAGVVIGTFFQGYFPFLAPICNELRRDFIWVGLLAATIMGTSSYIVAQEHARCEAQTQVITNTVDDAVKDANKPNQKDPFESDKN